MGEAAAGTGTGWQQGADLAAGHGEGGADALDVDVVLIGGARPAVLVARVPRAHVPALEARVALRAQQARRHARVHAARHGHHHCSRMDCGTEH